MKEHFIKLTIDILETCGIIGAIVYIDSLFITVLTTLNISTTDSFIAESQDWVKWCSCMIGFLYLCRKTYREFKKPIEYKKSNEDTLESK